MDQPTLSRLPRQAPPDDPDAHRERLAAIRGGAIVARLVGIAAMHRVLPDGTHEITHRGKTWTRDTLDQAIAAAQGRRNHQ